MKTVAELIKDKCAGKDVSEVMGFARLEAREVHQACANIGNPVSTEYIFADDSSLTVKGSEITTQNPAMEEYCDMVQEFYEVLEEFTQMKTHTIVDSTKLSCTATLAILQCMDENSIARKDAINICKLLSEALKRTRLL